MNAAARHSNVRVSEAPAGAETFEKRSTENPKTCLTEKGIESAAANLDSLRRAAHPELLKEP